MWHDVQHDQVFWFEEYDPLASKREELGRRPMTAADVRKAIDNHELFKLPLSFGACVGYFEIDPAVLLPEIVRIEEMCCRIAGKNKEEYALAVIAKLFDEIQRRMTDFIEDVWIDVTRITPRLPKAPGKP